MSYIVLLGPTLSNCVQSCSELYFLAKSWLTSNTCLVQKNIAPNLYRSSSLGLISLLVLCLLTSEKIVCTLKVNVLWKVQENMMICGLVSKIQVKWEIMSNFCGLLRIYELYLLEYSQYPGSPNSCLNTTHQLELFQQVD